jgi:hypothetical protein
VPLDRDFVDNKLGPPRPPDSKDVRASGEGFRSFGPFTGSSIPYDYRSYIFYGYTIISGGVKVPTRFEIDTRSPTLLVGLGLWHMAGTWYRPFDPDALRLLAVSAEEKELRPFSWISNVPIETIEEPPYREGQILHSRARPVPFKPPPPKRVRVIVRRGGRNVVKQVRSDSWLARIRRLLGRGQLRLARDSESESLRGIDLEDREIVLWSCAAHRPMKSGGGVLVLTNRRVVYRPSFVTRICGDRAFELRNREVTDVGLKSLQDESPPGGSKAWLRLVLVGDREELFVVDNPIHALERFSNGITPIGG